MAISAKRFSILDQESNLGIVDLYGIRDTLPRNLPDFSMDELLGSLDGFLKQDRFDSVKEVLADVADASMGVPRVTKDFFSAKLDLVEAAKVGLDKLSKTMFGGDNDKMNVVRQMAERCKAYMMSGLGSRKMSKKLLDCGNSKRHDRGTPCDLNLFGDLLSKMGGVDFNLKTIDINAIEKMLAGIGIQGYGIGLCNVWGAVSAGVSDSGILGRAASTILGSVSDNFDMMAVRDIGRSLQDGVNVTSAVPGIAGKIMSGFKIPSEISDSKLPGFGTSFGLSMLNIDPMWATAADGIPSLENFSNSTLSDAGRMLEATAYDKPFSMDVLDNMTEEVSDFGNDDYLFAGSQFGIGDAASELDDEFSSFF